MIILVAAPLAASAAALIIMLQAAKEHYSDEKNRRNVNLRAVRSRFCVSSICVVSCFFYGLFAYAIVRINGISGMGWALYLCTALIAAGALAAALVLSSKIKSGALSAKESFTNAVIKACAPNMIAVLGLVLFIIFLQAH